MMTCYDLSLRCLVDEFLCCFDALIWSCLTLVWKFVWFFVMLMCGFSFGLLYLLCGFRVSRYVGVVYVLFACLRL